MLAQAGGLVRIKDAERGDKRKKMRQRGIEPPFPTFLPGDAGEDDKAVLVAPPPDDDPIAVTYTGG